MDPPLASSLPNAKQQAKAKSDPRHWFVRSLHRRSMAVMVLSGFMTVWGLCGGSFTRRSATLTGLPLTFTGLFLFFVCFAIFLATRRR